MRCVVADDAESAKAGCGRRLRAAACAGLIGLSAMAGGCSLTMPFEERPAAAQADAEITGSITPRPPAEPVMQPGQVSPFSAKLDEEDWRRQKAALATALDPQGNGAPVQWHNPDSGARGSFTPAGNAYVVKHEICRAFTATVMSDDAEQRFEGSACRVTPLEWTVGAVTLRKRDAG